MSYKLRKFSYRQTNMQLSFIFSTELALQSFSMNPHQSQTFSQYMWRVILNVSFRKVLSFPDTNVFSPKCSGEI